MIRKKLNSAVVIAPKGVYRNWERLEIPIHLPDHIETRVTTWVAPSSRTKVDTKIWMSFQKLFKV